METKSTEDFNYVYAKADFLLQQLKHQFYEIHEKLHIIDIDYVFINNPQIIAAKDELKEKYETQSEIILMEIKKIENLLKQDFYELAE